MKHDVLFAGIDGSGKSTSLDHLIDRLDDSYSIIKIVNLDGSLIVKGEKELVFKRFYGFLQRMRPVSKRYRFYRLFLVLKYFYKLVVIKNVEHFRQCELVMYEIDYLLHPAVYVTYHFPSTQRLSSRARLRAFSRFFKGGGQPTIFYLDVDPDSAMERIRSRGKEIHAHENQDDLATLRQEFKNVIRAARQDGFYVHTISTTEYPRRRCQRNTSGSGRTPRFQPVTSLLGVPCTGAARFTPYMPRGHPGGLPASPAGRCVGAREKPAQRRVWGGGVLPCRAPLRCAFQSLIQVVLRVPT